jgi:hypothetical protein
VRPYLRALPVVVAVAASSPSCSTQQGTPAAPLSTFVVKVQTVNGKCLPPVTDACPHPVTAPFPANGGSTTDQWAFTIQAVAPDGVTPEPFTGYVGLTLEPGTVVGVTGGPPDKPSDVSNIWVVDGKASGVVDVIAAYGPARLWVEDLGYVPAAPGKVPQCSNGIDDNGNGLIDFPSDPGCYRADDDTEDGGTYAAGGSDPVQYTLPTIAQVRGQGGAVTPWPNEAVSIAASAPERLIVTHVASDGFFVTDMNPAAVKSRTNSLYGFNFSTPPDMAICDVITSLSGTASQFYGFTQLAFPTWTNYHVPTSACQVPDPFVIQPSLVNGSKTVIAENLYPYEAALVRIEGYQIAKFIGAGLAVGNHFGPGVSNCDYNGDGLINYEEVEPNCPQPNMCEGTCATTCDADPDCSEYTDFVERNEVKVSYPGLTAMILINVGTVPTFDVLTNAGAKLDVVTGVLTEFSGGDLNWTVMTRCSDDLVCPAEMGCTTQTTIPSNKACVLPPTMYDNDEGTN